MPKVTLDPWIEARKILKIGEIRADTRPEVTARQLGISRTAWFDRKRNPGMIRLKELRRMAKRMQLTDEELLELARGQ